MIVNAGYRGKVAAGVPKFTYTGQYNQRDDGVVELLTSGTLVFLEPKVIDVFMVGGGGGGGRNPQYSEDMSASIPFGGGGGGYTRTVKRVNVGANESFNIVVGSGGTSGSDGTASAFDTYSVNGGIRGGTGRTAAIGAVGGKGGSGGGGGAINSSNGGEGGTDGANGAAGYPSSYAGGAGQLLTTREFGDTSGKLYAGGGGGGRIMVSATPITSIGGAGGGGTGGFYNPTTKNYQVPAAGVANTGGGGGGGTQSSQTDHTPGASGGSGIVCFREAQELPKLAGTWVLNERLYAPENAISQYADFTATYGSSTINCTRAQIKTNEIVITSDAGRSITIYTFASNAWKSGSKYATWTFPAGATASDEFRAWLASNATKQ